MTSSRLISLLGLFVAIAFLGAAIASKPGGFDWKNDYVSTMLRGPGGPTRTLADIGAVTFCISIALIFNRLALCDEFAKYARLIRIAGIGSMLYSALTITPMHDLMVELSFLFFLFAAVPITTVLYGNRRYDLLAIGGACLLLFVVSIVIYYSHFYNWVLPWAQRISYSLFAGWLVSLDFAFAQRKKRMLN